MRGTSIIEVGDRGRMVIPAKTRSRMGWSQGTQIVMVESERGLVLMSRDRLKEHVQADYTGVDLVSLLMRERRAAAAHEDRP